MTLGLNLQAVRRDTVRTCVVRLQNIGHTISLPEKHSVVARQVFGDLEQLTTNK